MYQLPFSASDNIIELGGGNTPSIRPNMDFRLGPYVDIVGDLSEPLPFEDETFDGVFCSYAIEHISWRKVKSFVKEVHRILKDGGKAVFVTANLKEQAKILVEKEKWEENDICMIFGDQDYLPGNMHLTGFSESYAIEMFRDCGFSSVIVLPHPNTITDMIIEVTKKEANINPNEWDTNQRAEAFDEDYFNGGKKLGGYAYEGYWDYPVHYLTAQKILELQPKSVLEIGCARGYILKRLEDAGIPVTGLEISKHCYLTRATDGIKTWDITKTPWPINDKSIDLAYSVAVLEHIPEQYISAIAQELERTCHRGIHGIDIADEDGFDKTHVTIRDIQWWKERLPASHVPVNKESLEYGQINIPASDGLLKLNIGCCTVMFHHGWFNIDILDLTNFANRHYYQFVQHDVTKGIPFSDGDVDVIYASHFLEHLDYKKGLKFLKDCHRSMRSGGILRLAVPDTRLMVQSYIDGTICDLDSISNENKKLNKNCDSIRLWNLLTSGHKISYDYDSLSSVLLNAGFKNISRKNFRGSGLEILKSQTIDMFPEHSLYVEAYKD